MARARKTSGESSSETLGSAEGRSAETSGDKTATTAIRVEADIAYKLGIVSSVLKQKISDIISPLLRPIVEKLYADAMTKDAPKVDEKYK